MDLLSSQTIRALERGLSASSLRNKAIAQNIANVDTPKYKSKDVVFQKELELAKRLQAKKTNAHHIDFSTSTQGNGYEIRTNTNTVMKNNENNVDIDREMAILAENQIYYNALIDRINGKFSSLKTVARGGN